MLGVQVPISSRNARSGAGTRGAKAVRLKKAASHGALLYPEIPSTQFVEVSGPNNH